MNLLLSISAVFPIFFYLLAGAALRRGGKLSDTTMNQVNKIVYSYCFPFNMFANVYRTNIGEVLNPGFLITMLVLVLVVIVLNVLLVPRYFKDRAVQGSVMQGIIRGNMLLFALPVVSFISGPDQVGLVSLCIAIVVPVYNILCVVILESLRGAQLKPGHLALSIIKNPLILGAVLGLLVKLAGIRFPVFVERTIVEIAGIVTPVALVMLGGGLRIADTVTYRRELVVVSVAKLLLVPLLFVLTVKLLGFDKVAVTTAMALGAVPNAVSSYVMAKEMEADSVLAGQIVAVTTVLSMASVFLWVFVLSNLGWIG